MFIHVIVLSKSEFLTLAEGNNVNQEKDEEVYQIRLSEAAKWLIKNTYEIKEKKDA